MSQYVIDTVQLYKTSIYMFSHCKDCSTVKAKISIQNLNIVTKIALYIQTII